MSKAIALYIHTPFCRRKCSYCSFVSSARREADIPAYLAALKAELGHVAQSLPRTRYGASLPVVGSIYFGGGTPSLLSSGQIADLLATIRSLFSLDKNAEISIEANPGTVDESYLAALRTLGINRLSLGVQSLNDGELAMLGRIHTAKEAIQAVKFARGAGFDNLNLDLIYGLPHQTLSDWRETLQQAVDLGSEHLSLYALTLEEGTPLFRAIEARELPAIDPDLSAEQYELAEGLLEQSGYGHYEISNWAKDRCECRHNMVYWRNEDYLGVGVAAHSSIDGHRLANTGDIDGYLAGFAQGKPFTPEMDETIDADLQFAETVILGLRLCEGINLDEVNNRHAVDVLYHYRRQIKEMGEAGLLERKGANLRLTPRGRLLSNEVFWRLLPDSFDPARDETSGIKVGAQN